LADPETAVLDTIPGSAQPHAVPLTGGCSGDAGSTAISPCLSLQALPTASAGTARASHCTQVVIFGIHKSMRRSSFVQPSRRLLTSTAPRSTVQFYLVRISAPFISF